LEELCVWRISTEEPRSFSTGADEIANPNDLRILCSFNGVVMQSTSTSDTVFGVAELISYLFSVVEVFPDDIVSTSSPDGVGQGGHHQYS
jgi:2-keto-4-pentenoate hydratase/2-oxohepta-3-ene-1,7-dioic acid hydratase in catechol pathway